MKNPTRSEKQIAASRANGTRSKGPVTPQGKQNSSRNSTFHGLLADTVVLAAESRDRFLEMLESFLEEYQPSGPTENALVEKMTVARWQQFRIWGIQKASLDHDMARDAENDYATPDAPTAQRAVASFRNLPDGSSPMQLLLRYDVAADRQFNRSLARLLDLQERRSAVRTQQALENTAPAPARSVPVRPPPSTPVPVARPSEAETRRSPQVTTDRAAQQSRMAGPHRQSHGKS